MTKNEFELNLISATELSIEFARKLAINSFTEPIQYRICCHRIPSEEAEFLALKLDEERYPDIDTDKYCPPDGTPSFELTAPVDVANFLYRKGKVPVWININVDSVSESGTFILLRYSPRFSSEHSLIGYDECDAPPFNIHGPQI